MNIDLTSFSDLEISNIQNYKADILLHLLPHIDEIYEGIHGWHSAKITIIKNRE